MAPNLERDGFCVHRHVVGGASLSVLRDIVASALAGRAGARDGLALPEIQELARSPALRAVVEPVLGVAAFAFRATLFDKHANANWFVGWHQDLVVPVQQEVAVPGYGPWSHKPEGIYVQPPLAVLAELLAVRVDLDGSDGARGGLHVVPGSHARGIVAVEASAAPGGTAEPVAVAVPAGGVLCMRPLLLHRSARAEHAAHRRIVHLEFAARPLPEGLAFARAVR